MRNAILLNALARSLLSGEATVEGTAERAGQALGRRWPCLPGVAARYLEQFGGKTRPRCEQVVQFLLEDASFKRAWARHGGRLAGATLIGTEPAMQPAAAARDWKIPAIETTAALAEWLGISVSELEWFADLKGIAAKAREQKVSHYSYRILAKDSGSIRLIEAPKSRLKEIQRRILRGILSVIPAHPAVHGFVRGRSIKTFAAPHVRQRVVLKMDLKDFFPSITGRRIQALFRTAGYPETAADLLGGICANATPRNVWKNCDRGLDRERLREAGDLFRRPHLPQGAPTSPALANLCAYHVDCRLSGLAKKAGAIYSRYADDLAFSGGEDFERNVERFAMRAAAILLEEGFEVQHRKTRVMRRGARQYIAGVVINERVNTVRGDFDRLKATLTNCIRYRPESQNRDGHPAFRQHLEGRVGFVESVNPQKGVRLRRLLERIAWD